MPKEEENKKVCPCCGIDVNIAKITDELVEGFVLEAIKAERERILTAKSKIRMLPPARNIGVTYAEKVLKKYSDAIEEAINPKG